MSNKTNHTYKKARRKWPWILLLVLVGLIGLVRLSLLTTPVQNWVKNIIVSPANNQLRPKLSIGSLSGDLWNDVTLTNVVLTQDSTVASIDTVHLAYNPLSYFSDAFEIREVRLVRPFVKIKQQLDSTFNVEHWVSSTDTSSSNFAFSLSHFLIEDGKIDVSIPQLNQDSFFVIDDMNLAASLGYFSDAYRVNIADFNLKLKQTRLDAPLSLHASAHADEKSITLEKLAIATAHSMLQASGRAGLTDSTADVKAEATPLGWKDIAAYAKDMPVQKDMKMSFSLTGDAKQFDVNLNAHACLLYTSPSPRDGLLSRMPSSA